ncbi:MAG: gamma-glutamyl-gamma-aminobutyrate hydrolase family protein [Planctomycetota bacterium]
MPLNGFCLIGGDDYHPDAYGGHPQTENLLPSRRHHFDLGLAKQILEKSRMPVLGICCGHQLISIASGGM